MRAWRIGFILKFSFTFLEWPIGTLIDILCICLQLREPLE